MILSSKKWQQSCKMYHIIKCILQVLLGNNSAPYTPITNIMAVLVVYNLQFFWLFSSSAFSRYFTDPSKTPTGLNTPYLNEMHYAKSFFSFFCWNLHTTGSLWQYYVAPPTWFWWKFEFIYQSSEHNLRKNLKTDTTQIGERPCHSFHKAIFLL